jgi:hypothetical protein
LTFFSARSTQSRHGGTTHFSGFSLTKLIPDDSIACRMSEQVGNLERAAARSAQPYRRHIVGLPLQRSLFGLTAQAATTIGLPGLSSELIFQRGWTAAET